MLLLFGLRISNCIACAGNVDCFIGFVDTGRLVLYNVTACVCVVRGWGGGGGRVLD